MNVLIATTALTITAVQRTDRRLHQNLVTESEVHWYARAGFEMALAYVENTIDWRTQVADSLLDQAQIGDGQVTVEFFDDDDGDLTDDVTDSVRVVSTGERDGAVCRFEAELVPVAHDALQYTLFALGDIMLNNMVVVRGPVRGHGNILGNPMVSVEADARFETLSGYMISNNLQPQDYDNNGMMPPQVDLSEYLAKATPLDGVIPIEGQLQFAQAVFGPDLNSFGDPNPNGIYAVDAQGGNVEFTDLDLEGTLIVYNSFGGLVEFHDSCQMRTGPLSYPVLLVDQTCSEVWIDPGMEPREITGVVYAPNSRMVVKNGSWSFTGCLIGNWIEIMDGVIVEDAPSLRSTLMPGFLADGMRVVSGSYQEATSDDD